MRSGNLIMNNKGEAKPNLSYGAASDLFQRSFPGGSADQEWKYLGGTTFQFTNLKYSKNGEAVSRENKGVSLAIVTFDHENSGQTKVIEEPEGLIYFVPMKEAIQPQFLTRIFDSI